MSGEKNALKSRRLSGFLVAALVLLGMLFPAQGRAAGDDAIPVWNYYEFPPFVYGGEQGLSHDFVRLMNDMPGGAYRFVLVNLPRKRIDSSLAAQQRGIVLFVSPTWMNDADQNRYYWSRPLLADRNEILSNRAAPIEYNGLPSLYGKRLGGVRGRKYQAIDTAVSLGLISRQDSQSTEKNLEKLLLRRIDFLTAPRSILRSLIHKHGCEDQVHYSTEPFRRFSRHILVPRFMPEVYAEVESILDRLLESEDWRRLKEKYLVD